MKVHFCYVLLAVSALANIYVLAFNVDTYNYVRYEVEPSSMFGFSVALHMEDTIGWVLIGAPEAQSTQPGVTRGGVVYKCDISDDNRCQSVPFDRNVQGLYRWWCGNNYNTRREQTDTKSNQWFGATLTSAGINGPIVACAPRYVFHTLEPKKAERNEPVGTCYMLKDNFNNSREISPCRTSFWGYHRQGSCQAGLSAAVTKDGKRLFIGAPGSWYWQGQAYSVNTNAAFPYKPPFYAQFGEGQVYSTDLNNPENKVYATGERTSAEDDSYFGYSTATGDFDGDGVQDVAVGMPRGGGLLGKVLLFSWDMVNLDNITGEQIGAYFGYSLCAVDVDGDGLDDLLIGAPMYTEPNNEGKYEMGRIYIMFQGETDKFKSLETRDGVSSRGRFGLALSSLGDINLDGFNDFAVGAPYDGPNNKGAVYIYHGSKTGPLAKHSQVIYAEDLNIPYLSTFGFSLSGGLDLDGNRYPDLVVGAYESSKAIFFKSRPVAVVEASTNFLTESKLVSLDKKNCKTPRGGKEVACTRVKSCLKYNGVNLPTNLYLDVSWALDSKKPKSPRMFFVNDEGKNIKNSTMILYRGKPECREEEVYITDNIRDKLTPLEVEMRYNLVPAVYTGGRRKRATPDPVIDSNLGLVKRDSINIQKNCGPDNICIPDLRLTIKTVDQYLLGSRDLMVIDVLISNYGEDAFEAGFYMNMPQDLNFRKVEKIGDMRDTPVTCTAPSAATNNTLKCDIGNPLSAGKIANFKVIMIPSQKAGMAPSYDFYMEANSTNPENEGSNFDNVIKKSIGIWIETDLSIEGKSIPDEKLYNVSEFKALENATTENDLGPHVVHMYNIRNNGPSTIQEAEVYVLWPYETKGGDFLMYLLNQPETSGNIQCTPTTYVNQKDLKLDSILSRKSFLKSSGAVNIVNNAAWYGRQQGVFTEHSSSSISSSSGSSTSSRGPIILTDTEKRRLIEEEQLESKGDASYIHNQRAQDAAASAGATSGVISAGGEHRGISGQRQHSYQTSWSGSSQDGGPSVTYSTSRNRTVVHVPEGNYIMQETSTDHVGLAAFAHRPNSQFDASRSGYYSGSASGSNYKGQEGTLNQGYGEQRQQASNSDIYEQRRQQFRVGQVHGASDRQNTYNNQGSDEKRYSSQQPNQYETSKGGYNAGSPADIYHRQEKERNTLNGGQYNPGYGQRAHQQGNTGGLYHAAGAEASSRQYQSVNPNEGLYRQSGSRNQQHQTQSNYEANRIEYGRTGSGGNVSSKANYDSIDLEAQRQAYAQQSGVSTRRRMKSQQDGEPSRSDLVTGATSLEEMAQGGHGFKVSSVDLGVSNRGNVDDELRKTSEESSHYFTRTQGKSGEHGGGHSEGSNYYLQSGDSGSSDSTNAGSKYYSHSSYSKAGGSGGSSSGYKSYSSSHGPETQEQMGLQHESYGSSVSSDPRLTLYPRVRRNIDSIENDQERDLEKALHCDIVRCAAIRCVVGPLANDDEAWIAIRTRLIATTLHKLAPSVPLNISTRAVSRVTKLPYIGAPKDMPIKSHEILFTAIPEPVAKPDVVPLWVVILSACAGAVILLLLIFLLYKCGFFKRNRPSDSSERQPLNRNGNYHGDEHL